jgi:thymidylate kinase
VILIFEGADKVGKSTLAQHYANRWRCGIVKTRWELGDPAFETKAFANVTHEMLSVIDSDVVFDRTYFSYWAYAPALGSDAAFMPGLIARFRSRTPALLVVCTADPSELRRRYAADPDQYFSLEAVLAANERFPSLLPLVPPSLPALHLDTTSTRTEDAIAHVDRFLSEQADEPSPLHRVAPRGAGFGIDEVKP